MIFRTLSNIEKTFRFSRTMALAAVVCSFLFAGTVVVLSYIKIEHERQKIYVLDRGKSLILALQQDMQQNRPVEARDHVRMFHELFFTLAPDNEAINSNMRRAFELADQTAYNYYKDLLEAGYYNRIVRSNILQRIIIDSIGCDFDSYPYEVTTYCQQVIIRESIRHSRTLVTTCQLVNATRSDNNPHGFLMRNFRVVENKQQED